MGRKVIPLLLVLVLFMMSLSGCGNNKNGTGATAQPSASDSSAPSTKTAASAADKLFTIRYDSGKTMNPISGTDADNAVVSTLMYEGLFALDKNFKAQPVLCQDCTTTNGIDYTITIKPNIAMSDGSILKAIDVAYSIDCARSSARYGGRLALIGSVNATGSDTLTISLTATDYELPEDLDIPIIKYGSKNESVPPGTGPYVFSNNEKPCLTALSSYRDIAKLPVGTIYLADYSDTSLTEAFANQTLDLFWDDPTGVSPVNTRNDHEARYYNTTILEYIGFNTKKLGLYNASVRRALSYAIDRNDIVKTALSGHALIAPLIISPAWYLYDSSWEQGDTDTIQKVSTLFANIGMSDANNDGYLEYPTGRGYAQFSIDFIVNSDNEYKVSAAQRIADKLKTAGIDVTLRELSWDDYLKALKNGDYGMYYGDVALPSDYNLTELLSPGGSLDYGSAGSKACSSLINALLAAPDDNSRKAAAQQLCAYVEENAPIIPVLYKQYAVHTNRNVITGMTPTQTSVFYGITGWTINLG